MVRFILVLTTLGLRSLKQNEAHAFCLNPLALGKKNAPGNPPLSRSAFLPICLISSKTQNVCGSNFMNAALDGPFRFLGDRVGLAAFCPFW